MASAPSKLYQDDVSLVVALLDTNPFFWAAASLPFSEFLHHVVPFINSLLLLNQLNRVVLIATGTSSCGYIFDSGDGNSNGNANAVCSGIIKKLDDFIGKGSKIAKGSNGDGTRPAISSLLSGSLSLALCYIQRIFRSGARHPQPRILCIQGSPDGPEQYVAVMNSIFSAQRSMVPIDSCIVGAQHSAFLQQASYITGGVYMKPQQLDGLFQYLALLCYIPSKENPDHSLPVAIQRTATGYIPAVFATDLHSRNFLHLPKPVGVDFRASCFCHKKTIDMGYVCSVCLSIFCKYHKKCSTCGSDFNQVPVDSTTPEQKR